MSVSHRGVRYTVPDTVSVKVKQRVKGLPRILGDRHLASRGGCHSKDVDKPRGGGSDPPSKKFTPLGGGV